MTCDHEATNLDYPSFMPRHLRYRCCPICAGTLANWHDDDGLFRARCRACGWIYYPPNLIGVNVVATAPDGVVFLFPPNEPADAPAALPGGCVEFGERPEDAARREVREETGLEVEIVRLLGHYFDRDIPYAPMLSLIFEARVMSGVLRGSKEGRVAIRPATDCPTISPNRTGSQRALAAYLDHLQRVA